MTPITASATQRARTASSSPSRLAVSQRGLRVGQRFLLAARAVGLFRPVGRVVDGSRRQAHGDASRLKRAVIPVRASPPRMTPHLPCPPRRLPKQSPCDSGKKRRTTRAIPPAKLANHHVAAPTHRFQTDRDQGRLVAAGRFGRGPRQAVVAGGARRGHRKTSWRQARRAGGLLRRHRARPRPAEAAARRAEAGGKPGRRRRGPDRARAHLVGGARPARHRDRADSADAAGHRGAAALSQRALDDRAAARLARGAGDQRERHHRHQRDPLRRQRPPRRARRQHGDRRPPDPAVGHRRPLRRTAEPATPTRS